MMPVTPAAVLPLSTPPALKQCCVNTGELFVKLQRADEESRKSDTQPAKRIWLIFKVKHPMKAK